ncbi:MAG: hypothetical protein ACYTAF_04385 [Planctomycetota bacterium]|jgi:hypothetical protein
MKAVVLILGLLAQEGPLSVEEGPRARLSGRADLHYVHRDGAIEETRNRLNGAPAAADDANFIAGPVSLRLDLMWEPDVAAALELGNLPINMGANVPFGTDPEATRVFVNEAWVQVRRFPAEALTLRLGAQPFRFTNRYDDEPFFLDVSGAESAWTGLTAAGTAATADRDTVQPVGARLWYDAAIFLKVQAFALTLIENGHPGDDESVYGFQASAKTSDVLTLKLLGTLFAGPAHDSSVWTIGGGVVHAPHRDWLLSGEIYGQSGDSMDGMDKSAWAAHLSVRYAGSSWWADAAYEHASGDDPDDADDDGWQSYENTNRFAIVQSAELGLDRDTNYRLLRAGWEYRWEDRAKLRFDLGWFSAPEKIQGVTGSGDDGLGVEIDGAFRYHLNGSASLYARGALLLGSDLLDAATADDDDNAWLVVIGTCLQF